MRIFIKIDSNTIKEPIYSEIVSAVRTMESVEHDVFVFEFCPLEFTHAQNLLSQHPETYGQDLSFYLPNVATHFNQTEQNREISLGFGGDDFKRRMAEDMGVGMAALFMHKAFGVSWKTILQIPSNNKLVAKRPDFQGNNDRNEIFLFEAKGTTCPKNVAKQINQGLEQVKAFPKESRTKYVVASFFSGAVNTFPSTVFVVDPPGEGKIIEDRNRAIALHYVHVLKFLGLDQQAKAWRELLSADLSIDGNASSQSRERKYWNAKQAYERAWGGELGFEPMEIEDETYLTLSENVETRGGVFQVTRGIENGIFERLKSGDFLGPQGSDDERGLRPRGMPPSLEGDFSLFDDGSLFKVVPIGG